MCTYVGVSGSKNCSFFGKFGVLCFLETSVLRFTLLPYYRRIALYENMAQALSANNAFVKVVLSWKEIFYFFPIFLMLYSFVVFVVVGIVIFGVKENALGSFASTISCFYHYNNLFVAIIAGFKCTSCVCNIKQD